MLIAHLEHGEVYVPSIEKTYFRSIARCKKNLGKAPDFFVYSRVDTDDKVAIATSTSHERAVDST
jgi:hypothetical protein